MAASSKTPTSLLLICMLFISSAAPSSACGSCTKHKPHHNPKGPSWGPAPPPPSETCPIDTVKLGACVDLLGGLIHIGLGDAVVNQCCPVLQGLVELEAAVCLCATLRIKVLNLDILIPLALQLLVTCGKTPPPGFTCSL